MKEISQIERSIGRLEGKLDSVIATMIELRTSFDNLEKGRLSRLEIAFADMKGRMAIIAGVVSMVISLAFVILNHYWR